MTLTDLDEVMAIERASFAYPWSSSFFHQEFRVEYARSIIAEMNGKIVGYVLFWLLPETVDIHNLAVSREYRRRGVGRILLHKVILEALRQSSARVTLEVRTSNLAAQKLYESAGFVATGVRKAYYSDNGEDALTMALELLPSTVS
jgi:[ribosomal protein S18]-alanine N-acetyltransferase